MILVGSLVNVSYYIYLSLTSADSQHRQRSRHTDTFSMDHSRATSDLTESLPPELLSRIFLFSRSLVWAEPSLDDHGDTGGSSGEDYIRLGESTYILDTTKCPTSFRILLVCHRWRDIALAESRLWTDIDVDDPPSPLLCFLLEYSKRFPVSFSGWTRFPSPATPGRFNTILNHISRFELLSFDFPGPEPSEYSRALRELFSPTVSDPVLKTLRLRWSERRRGINPPLIPNSRHPATSLVALIHHSRPSPTVFPYPV